GSSDWGASEHAELTTTEGDTITIPWGELDDCAHFVSCCLGQGGRFSIPGSVNGVYGKYNVDDLIGWLAAHPATKVLGRSKRGITLSPAEARDSLDDLQEGDVIGFFPPLNGYIHSALYLGQGNIACHTYCRSDQLGCTWDNSWDSVSAAFAYTFIHMP